MNDPAQTSEPTVGMKSLERVIGRYGELSAPSGTRTALVVIGGMHGNEPKGIQAAARVIETLNHEQPSAFAGQLIALRGNLAALNHPNADARYIAHDLNRLFTETQIQLSATTSPEHAQMQELLAELRSIRARCDRMIVIDLHTTSSAMPPVVVLEDSIPTRRMARRMPLPIYLGFEEELHGLLIDRATSEMRAIAMVVEGGQHRDPRAVEVLEAVIWTMLDAAGMLPIGALHHTRDPHRALLEAAGDEHGMIFDIRHRHAIGHADFAISEGIVSGRKIKRDVTIIAREGGSAVTSPVRGQVFMPNMQVHKRPGDDGFFIVRRVGEGWLGLSARLRRQRWLHWVIAHMPGVYACDDRTLCVDADLAAVLRRQILHLLGYRLVRHDARSSGHGLGRVYKGSIAFVRALLRGPIPGGPDPKDPRFWIVRRHMLDE